jgi:hypothetical protein
MHRRLTLLTVAALTAVLLYPIPASGRADPTRAEAWRAIAQRALDRVDVLTATGVHRSFTLAYATQATVWLSPDGWNDPAALAYLDRVYATALPDGGYGLGYAYDAHGDGTTNPASTSYVVSLAGHVGPVLLDGYRAGRVPRPKVQAVFDLVATAPRIDTAAGRCIAYSRSANDAKAGLCVHNVNAGAAWFLMEAGKDGFAVPWWLVQGIVKRELSAYNASTRFWPYRDNMAPAPQDADHNSYTVESMYHLAYPVGYSAAYVAMYAEPDADPQTALVGMRLAGLPPAPTAMSGTTTVWCLLGDTWLNEADAYATANWGDAVRLAQVAYYSARAARACA